MRHEHDNALRQAHNTLAEANRRLDSGKVKDPREHAMLISMIRDATEITKNYNAMDNKLPYSNTNIGYGANIRQRDATSDYRNDMVNDALDMVAKILPHIADDDRYNVDDRRGVPGTGRRAVRRVRADRYDDDRYDMDDDRYDDDDLRVVDQPRWRSARTGRFLPNLYGPSRVRRVRRRAEMDKMDTRYDDDKYDDDSHYDDTQRTADDINRTADETRRMTNEARRAADEARRAADDARRTTDDMRNISPVMRDDRNIRYDERRSDTEARFPRTDDADDRMRRPGPDMRR